MKRTSTGVPETKKRLITSALPYVNNIPHLGNLIQVLSADVFARFCRRRGYETLYVCGTDEYGTATETRAREEGVEPQELCSRYHAIHTDIYNWFSISFDKWGRTSTPEHTRVTQDIFLKLYENGFIQERTIEQLYSEPSQMFLADRYVRGTCPKCGYADARGDQCEDCGSLLDPTELIEPRSAIDGSVPVIKETTHLYIDLPAILPKLEAWLSDASVKGRWAKNAIQMTQAWIRDGLKERAITRDLKWGIPVPLNGFENKVFYVWFDAPIGYISITATLTGTWAEDWWKNPDEVELFQFIGKDNIPFHTVIFPSSLLGSGDDWTMLHHMSSSEYLNYEGGQFSKSKGIGVFGTDAQSTGIPADVWRFYIFYNRPETSDFTFTWNDFREKTNGELIGNLSNLVNRTLTFLHRYYNGVVLDETLPQENTRDGGARLPAEFWDEIRDHENAITDLLEWARLRDAFRRIFALSSYGNRVFQAAEPWKTRVTDPEGTHRLLSHLVYLIRDLSILIEPYIPTTATRIQRMLGDGGSDSGNPEPAWNALCSPGGLTRIDSPEILFEQLSEDRMEVLRERFSGSQAERAAREVEQSKKKEVEMNTEDPIQTPTPEQRFAEKIELRVARIVEIERHPEAEKLYIEKLDDGTEDGRTIVSGLVPHYREDELLNRNIIVVANLKPAKLRGVKSEGMLLAASSTVGEGEDAQETVEVLFADSAVPGDRVLLEGQTSNTSVDETLNRIKVDHFFAVPIISRNGVVLVGSTPLIAGNTVIRAHTVLNGSVG